MIISLIGYMGSGKSLIANYLQNTNNFEKIDLDSEISKNLEMSIPEIFEKKGEIFFRKTEKEILQKILLSEKNTILSLGGGTPCYYDNMELINDKSISIYLRAGVNTLVNRLFLEKNKRPLIKKIPNEKLPEFIGQHLFERNHFYNQAKIVIDTDNLSPVEITKKINEQLNTQIK